jgi:hypothetical protein
MRDRDDAERRRDSHAPDRLNALEVPKSGDQREDDEHGSGAKANPTRDVIRRIHSPLTGRVG